MNCKKIQSEQSNEIIRASCSTCLPAPPVGTTVSGDAKKTSSDLSADRQVTQIKRIPFRTAKTKNPLNPLNPMTNNSIRYRNDC